MVAHRFREGIMAAVVHRQVQRVRTRTAVGIGVFVYVRTRLRVGRTVPCVTLAHRLSLNIVRAVVHRQVQGHYRVTAVGGGEDLWVVAALRVSRAVPFVAFADRCLRIRMGCSIHRQFKRVGGFATVHLFGTRANDHPRRGGLILRDGKSVSNIGFALTNLIVECLRFDTVHHDSLLQRIRTPA